MKVTQIRKKQFENSNYTVHDLVFTGTCSRDTDQLEGLDSEPVEYSVDARLLVPTMRFSGTLFAEVPNRGTGSIDEEAVNATISGMNKAKRGRGGFVDLAPLMQAGHAVLNLGWQNDVPLAAGKGFKLGSRLPLATENGKPIQRYVRQEVNAASRFFGSSRKFPVNGLVDLDYNLADNDSVRVFVRRFEEDGGVQLPASSVVVLGKRQLKISSTAPVPETAIFDIHYLATDATVSGLGLVAYRDVLSFVKSGKFDLVSPRHVVGFGVSQSARFLRTFLYHGFNADLGGLRVLDGVVNYIAGARRGDFIGIFNNSGAVSTQQFNKRIGDNNFPFAYATSTDVITGKTDGILHKYPPLLQPKIIHVDTDNDMSAGFGWLCTTQTDGKTPTEELDNVRHYFLAGLQHIPYFKAIIPGKRSSKGSSGVTLHYNVFLKASLLTMADWVDAIRLPPMSRYPTLKDDSLVSLAVAQRLWPTIEGVPYSTVRNVPCHIVETVSKDVVVPAVIETYPVLTPPVNSDGNETCGVIHPAVQVPLGTYSGHSVARNGIQTFLEGEFIPFKTTRAERYDGSRLVDSRLSVEERYSASAYSTQITAAAKKLVKEGFLLEEDIGTVTRFDKKAFGPVAKL
ncbi:hypothetical protein CJU90_1017 [Yarrowia sp. C11]|nr:hypothetical protein CJU90_1017 [Yarrowia sp. C11]